MRENRGSGLGISMRMNLSTIERGSERKGKEARVGEVETVEKVGKLMGVNGKTRIMLWTSPVSI